MKTKEKKETKEATLKAPTYEEALAILGLKQAVCRNCGRIYIVEDEAEFIERNLQCYSCFTIERLTRELKRLR